VRGVHNGDLNPGELFAQVHFFLFFLPLLADNAEAVSAFENRTRVSGGSRPYRQSRRLPYPSSFLLGRQRWPNSARKACRISEWLADLPLRSAGSLFTDRPRWEGDGGERSGLRWASFSLFFFDPAVYWRLLFFLFTEHLEIGNWKNTPPPPPPPLFLSDRRQRKLLHAKLRAETLPESDRFLPSHPPFKGLVQRRSFPGYSDRISSPPSLLSPWLHGPRPCSQEWRTMTRCDVGIFRMAGADRARTESRLRPSVLYFFPRHCVSDDEGADDPISEIAIGRKTRSGILGDELSLFPFTPFFFLLYIGQRDNHRRGWQLRRCEARWSCLLSSLSPLGIGLLTVPPLGKALPAFFFSFLFSSPHKDLGCPPQNFKQKPWH